MRKEKKRFVTFDARVRHVGCCWCTGMITTCRSVPQSPYCPPVLVELSLSRGMHSKADESLIKVTATLGNCAYVSSFPCPSSPFPRLPQPHPPTPSSSPHSTSPPPPSPTCSPRHIVPYCTHPRPLQGPCKPDLRKDVSSRIGSARDHGKPCGRLLRRGRISWLGMLLGSRCTREDGGSSVVPKETRTDSGMVLEALLVEELRAADCWAR